MTAVAEKTAETEPAAETTRKEPAIQVNCVWRNRAGSRWCEWDCILPEGAGVDALEVPGLWWRVQQHGGSALKRHDEVRIRAFDSSWVAHCYVAHASLTEVILNTVHITKLSGPREHLFEDDLYAVRFVGNGYAVFRKTDGQEMAPAVHSAAAAQSVLVNQYPQRVS